MLVLELREFANYSNKLKKTHPLLFSLMKLMPLVKRGPVFLFTNIGGMGGGND